MSDDAADVQRVLAGDVDAYAALVDRYYDRCARFAIRMLGNRDDAEDALQATFLRAYRALNRYQERDRFSAWLYRILVNQCRSVAARRSHRERVFVREEALLLNAPDRTPNWSGEEEEFVQRVLERIGPVVAGSVSSETHRGYELRGDVGVDWSWRLCTEDARQARL